MIAETSTSTKTGLPQSLGELFSLIVREAIKGFFKKIPILVLFFIGSVVAHIFLMVVVNEGFGWSPTLLGDFLATRGNTLTSILLWSVIPSLIFANLRRVKELGQKEYVNRISSGVKWVQDSYRKTDLSLKLLVAGTIAGLVLISLTRNRLLALVVFIGVVLEIAFRSESFWFFFLKLSWGDYQKYKKSNPVLPYEISKAGILTGGFALGTLVGFLLPGVRLYGLTGWIAIGIVFGVYWYFTHKSKPTTLIIIAVCFALLGSLSLVSSALADDGGWSESGGTLSEWVRSEGATEATGRGIPPAAGGVIGISIGIGLEEICLKRKKELNQELIDHTANPVETRSVMSAAPNPELLKQVRELDVLWFMGKDGKLIGPVPRGQDVEGLSDIPARREQFYGGDGHYHMRTVPEESVSVIPDEAALNNYLIELQRKQDSLYADMEQNVTDWNRKFEERKKTPGTEYWEMINDADINKNLTPFQKALKGWGYDVITGDTPLNNPAAEFIDWFYKPEKIVLPSGQEYWDLKAKSIKEIIASPYEKYIRDPFYKVQLAADGLFDMSNFIEMARMRQQYDKVGEELAKVSKLLENLPAN